MMNVFPIFLNNLHAQRTVVFGGDEHEAERKVGQLLDSDAWVEVIAPEVSPQLARWADEGRIEWRRRRYEAGDLEDAVLVFATEIDPEYTAPIYEEAQRENVLICAMDDIPRCTFVNGSQVRRGKLNIAISTSGCAPVLAVRLRERLEEMIGPEHEEFLEIAGALRDPLKKHNDSFQDRRDRWYTLVDSDVLDLLAAGDRAAAHRRVAEIMGENVAADAGLFAIHE